MLQIPKLRVSELQYNFFNKFCGLNKFEELEMDTDSLYVDLAEKVLEDCIRAELKTELERLRSKECTDSFTAEAKGAVTTTKIMIRESLDSLNRKSHTQRCCVYAAKLTAAAILLRTNVNSVAKV